MSGARPEDVHPEHDRPTPGNIDDWSDEQVEQYNELKDAQLDEEARENRIELSTDEAAALEKLGKSTETATVTFDSGVEVAVKRHLNPEIEDRFDAISGAEDLATVREELVTATAWLIDDEHYGSERIWQAYLDEYGTRELFGRFMTAVDPALERMDELGEMDRFRSE